MKWVWMLLIVASAAAQTAHYRYNGTTKLPDATVTPGATNPDAVADLSGKPHMIGNIEMNICAKDFRSTAIRKTIKNFAGLKKKACAEYDVTKCDASVEGDHLISLEIGGCKDCMTNIWPQDMDQARIKDHEVEDKLPRLVCTGKIKLADAQSCISTDWVVCAARIKDM